MVESGIEMAEQKLRRGPFFFFLFVLFFFLFVLFFVFSTSTSSLLSPPAETKK